MPFAASLSQHPVAADAVGEVLGSVIEQHGIEPDLALVFASGDHVEFLGEIDGAVRRLLRPAASIGASASSVVGGRREVEDGPALAVWAAWSEPMATFRLTAERQRNAPEPTATIRGLPGDLAPTATLLVLADPFSFPAQGLLDGLAEARPDLAVVGGLIAGGGGPGDNVLLVDGEVHRDGAVGAVLPPTTTVRPVVSQGCRPIGEPMVVTRAERNYLHELAGQPAWDRLRDLTASATPAERALLAQGVHLGIVIDEHLVDHGQGDFLIRTVLGADRDKGVLAVGAEVSVGTTVQFHVRDAASADDDLRDALGYVRGDGALVFTCNGRGRHLFGTDDHDAEAVADALDTTAVAGMSCAGELGPVGGRSFLHGFTASVVVFEDP